MPANIGASEWLTPFDLLRWLSACGVELCIGPDPERWGRPKLYDVDPNRVLEPGDRWAIRFWEQELIELIRERRLDRDQEPAREAPAWVVFTASKRGNLTMHYRRSSGAIARYWRRENGRWQPI